jgi:hypothetical protein
MRWPCAHETQGVSAINRIDTLALQAAAIFKPTLAAN